MSGKFSAFRFLCSALALVSLLSCTDSCQDAKGFDQALSDRHREALPKLSWLQMPGAQLADANNDSHFVPALRQQQQDIEDFLQPQLDLLALMADRDPSSQDLNQRLSTWGPFVDERVVAVEAELWLTVRSGFAPVDSSIVDAGPIDQGLEMPLSDSGSDDSTEPEPTGHFVAEYTLSRRIKDQGETESAVFWGATYMSPDGWPQGLLVWDFSANRAWEQAYNPVAMHLEDGRSVWTWSSAPSAAEASRTLQHWTQVAWRDFLPASADSSDNPANFDQYWGRLQAREKARDFVHLTGPSQLDDDVDSAPEWIDAAINLDDKGAGRADFSAQGGDIPAGFHAEGQQCWSHTGTLQFASSTLIHNSGAWPSSPLEEPHGRPENCQLEEPWPLPLASSLPEAMQPWLTRAINQGLQDLEPLHHERQ